MTVSVIIAAKTWAKNLEECVNKCRMQDVAPCQIIVLPDESCLSMPQGVEIIPTGPLSPSKKRDIALRQAKGEILAFIDDDAWPSSGWLKHAQEIFKDSDVAAVGGPAVTPADDTFRQKASGLVYGSPLVSGKFAYRYLPKKRRAVDDLPTCNLLVRKSVMQELSGFNTVFWPGEDTKLCWDITKRLGKKIIYDPRVLVHHHRRRLFAPHLKQIAGYALHRGYFVKRYPATSLRTSYFIPSLFLGALFTGSISALFLPALRGPYLFGVSLYLLMVFIFSLHKDLRFVPWVFTGTILTHLVYGLYFLKGLFALKLPEEKG